MSTTEVHSVEMNLEIQVIPVSDPDRAKQFYQRLGWRLDDDVAPLDGLRIVQFTPPGSAASITFGQGLTKAAPGFPWATLVINVVGSLIIGFYATLTGPDGRVLARPEHRQFIMTGFCGGYTTFSTFSLETFRLFHGGAKYTALAYIGASLIGWLTAVWLGHLMAGRYNRLKRS